MSDQPKDPGYCTPGYCSPSKHDRTPPVASSQQGRTVTADEARESMESILRAVPFNPYHPEETAWVIDAGREVVTHIDQSEARIRELEEAVGAWWSSHRPMGIDAEKHATPEYRHVNCPSNTSRRLADLAADIVLARRALNRDTTDE